MVEQSEQPFSVDERALLGLILEKWRSLLLFFIVLWGALNLFGLLLTPLFEANVLIRTPKVAGSRIHDKKILLEFLESKSFKKKFLLVSGLSSTEAKNSFEQYLKSVKFKNPYEDIIEMSFRIEGRSHLPEILENSRKVFEDFFVHEFVDVLNDVNVDLVNIENSLDLTNKHSKELQKICKAPKNFEHSVDCAVRKFETSDLLETETEKVNLAKVLLKPPHTASTVFDEVDVSSEPVFPNRLLIGFISFLVSLMLVWFAILLKTVKQNRGSE